MEVDSAELGRADTCRGDSPRCGSHHRDRFRKMDAEEQREGLSSSLEMGVR